MPKPGTSTNRSCSPCAPFLSALELSEHFTLTDTAWRAQYIDEKLTDPQRENHEQLITDLNDNLLRYIGRNRFWSEGSAGSLARARDLSQVGPFTAREATKEGLLNGTCYRQDVLDSVLDPEMGGDAERKVMGFYHYGKIMEKTVQKFMEKETVEVGVVYLQGTIGEVGE